MFGNVGQMLIPLAVIGILEAHTMTASGQIRGTCAKKIE